MAKPRQHHVVSAFYLQRFARAEGKKRPSLHVLDLETGTWTRQSPKRAARRRDYYAIDAPGLPKHVVEDEFVGKIEAAAAPIIDRVCRMDLPLRGEELGHVLAFAALMYVRTEGPRRAVRARADQIARKLLGDLAANRVVGRQKLLDTGSVLLREGSRSRLQLGRVT